MFSGNASFQDLLNLDTTELEIDDIKDDITALTADVVQNTSDIKTNTLAIGVNTSNILTNGNLITTNIQDISDNKTATIDNSNAIIDNSVDILTNASGIISNSTNIGNNASAITLLNNSYLDRDGSILLSGGYTPTNPLGLVSKDYVDTEITASTADFLPLTGGDMLGSINMNGSDIVGTDSTLLLQSSLGLSNSSVFLNYGVIQMSCTSDQIDVDGAVIQSLGVPTQSHHSARKQEVDDLNTALSADIKTNTDGLAQELIDRKAADDAQDIIIGGNATAIALRLPLAGGTMTGSIDMDSFNLLNCNNINGIPPWYITDNASRIGVNEGKILTLESDVLTLQGTALVKSGVVLLDIAYTPTVGRGISTKKYVDDTGDNILDGTSIFLAGSLPKINEADITTANLNIALKLNKAGDNMTGNLVMQDNAIREVDYLECDILRPNATSTISAETNTFQITAGTSGDALLVLRADTDNSNEADTGRIEFWQDGDIVESGIYMDSNQLNISNSVNSNAGIVFRTDTSIAASAIYNAPVRMEIEDTGGIRINDNYLYLDATDTTSYLSTSGSTAVELAGPTSVLLSDSSDTMLIASMSAFETYSPVQHYAAGADMASLGTKQLSIIHPLNTAAGWSIGNQKASPSTTDCDLYFSVSRIDNEHVAGYVQDSSTNVKMNFTGQHRVMPIFEYDEDKIGLIVDSTGKYMNLIAENKPCSNKGCISINDSLPKVTISTTFQSKKVFGVISGLEPEKRTYDAGNFSSLYDKVQGDSRLFVNSIGEGGMWICNSTGNFENGDYVMSSGIKGYGCLQADDILHNYTVAKITMDCDFNPGTSPVRIYDGYDEKTQEIIWKDEVDENGNVVYEPNYECKIVENGLKIAFVGVTYHCG